MLALGANLIKGEVRDLAPANGGARLILTDGTQLQARQVVIAAGAWSKRLAMLLGDAIPLETERGYNTTLPPGAFDLDRQLIFGEHGFVVTPLSTGIRIGRAVELGGLKLAPDFRRSEVMLRKAQRFLPGLNTENGRQWMGFRPSLPDTLPVIGTSSATRAIVYAFGHGHLGLTQCSATACLVAKIPAGREPAISITPFRPDRF